MFRRTLVLMSLLAGTGTAGLSAQAPTYPPFSEYAMPRDAELQLVRTAAPSTITDRATLKVLTQSGYQVAREGDNGFTCFVMRGWTARILSAERIWFIINGAVTMRTMSVSTMIARP